MERTPNSRVKPKTLNWDPLSLSLHSRVIGSAHCLTEINIWVKFNENRSKGSRDMGRTPNSTGNPMTLNCDLGFESVLISRGFCTTTH